MSNPQAHSSENSETDARTHRKSFPSTISCPPLHATVGRAESRPLAAGRREGGQSSGLGPASSSSSQGEGVVGQADTYVRAHTRMQKKREQMPFS